MGEGDGRSPRDSNIDRPEMMPRHRTRAVRARTTLKFPARKRRKSCITVKLLAARDLEVAKAIIALTQILQSHVQFSKSTAMASSPDVGRNGLYHKPGVPGALSI